MRVIVTMLDGWSNEFDMEPSDTVGRIKRKVSGILGIPPEEQQMALAINLLDEDRATLADSGILEGDSVTLVRCREESAFNDMASINGLSLEGRYGAAMKYLQPDSQCSAAALKADFEESLRHIRRREERLFGRAGNA